MDYGGVLTDGPPVALPPARLAGVPTALLSDAAAAPDAATTVLEVEILLDLHSES